MHVDTSPYMKLTLASSRRRSFVYRASSNGLDWWQDVTAGTEAGEAPCCTLAADADVAGNLASDDNAGSAVLRLLQMHLNIFTFILTKEAAVNSTTNETKA